MLTMTQAEKVMHENGMRVTTQRKIVVDYLSRNSHHPTAEQVASHVQKQMPNVALSTVYSILHELAGLDLIREFDDEGVMRFDPREEPHAHLICDSCNSIIDIPLSEALCRRIEQAAFDAHCSSVDSYHVDIAGICPACKQR